MAKEMSRFFDAVKGDRQYSAAEFAAYFGETGVFDAAGGGDGLRVEADRGLRIKVYAGEARIKGYGYWLESDGEGYTELELEAAGFYPRIDRIVLRLVLDLTNRKIGLLTRKGREAVTPAALSLIHISEPTRH